MLGHCWPATGPLEARAEFGVTLAGPPVARCWPSAGRDSQLSFPKTDSLLGIDLERMTNELRLTACRNGHSHPDDCSIQPQFPNRVGRCSWALDDAQHAQLGHQSSIAPPPKVPKAAQKSPRNTKKKGQFSDFLSRENKSRGRYSIGSNTDFTNSRRAFQPELTSKNCCRSQVSSLQSRSTA